MVSAIDKALKKAPLTSGVYLFKDIDNRVIYVGKAINLRTRLRFYVKNYPKNSKINALVNQTEKVQIIKVASEIEALLVEINLIKKLRPKFNLVWRDDKRPIYVKITNQKLPRVSLSRKIEERGIKLYGPFPSVNKLKQVLKFLRRIFPYCSCKKPKKGCLWVDIGLCPSIPQMENIKFIKMFLTGRVRLLLKVLNQKMRQAALKEEFEKAATLRDKIKLLQFLVESRKNLDHYLNTPSLLADITQTEINALKQLLSIKRLVRIEGYDIANLQGKSATGAMVVFENGYPVKDSYRRFKIYALDRPNDPAMMAQVITRRLNHQEWEFPDLVIIDGGKSQVSAVLSSLKKNSLPIPVIGITKQFEEIVIPLKNRFVSYRLASDSVALKLIQRVRDEAHRFATTYHKKLVLKNLVK